MFTLTVKKADTGHVCDTATFHTADDAWRAAKAMFITMANALLPRAGVDMQAIKAYERGALDMLAQYGIVDSYMADIRFNTIFQVEVY